MKLTGKQYEQVKRALLSAYPDYEPLRHMVRIGLDENLPEIAGGANLTNVVSSLILWAETHRFIPKLIRAAYETNREDGKNPGHPKLRELVEELPSWRELEDSQDDYVGIRYGPTVDASAEEKELLQLALSNRLSRISSQASYDEVQVVERLAGGYSGAVVLLVDPISRQGRGLAPIVAKIASYAELSQEYSAYIDHIEQAAPLIAISIQSEPWRSPHSELGIILYTFGAPPRQKPLSLEQYYYKEGGRTTAQSLDNLMLVHGLDIWGQGNAHPFWFGTEYDRLLPVHLEVTPVASEAPSTMSINVGGITSREISQLPTDTVVELEGFYVVKTREIREDAPPRLSEFRALLQADSPPTVAKPALRILLIQDDESIKENGLTRFVANQAVPRLKVKVRRNRNAFLAKVSSDAFRGFDSESTNFTISDELSPSIKVITQELPNPLIGIESVLEKTSHVRWSVIHGDFNLRNILVDPSSGYATLIDFAETRRGPTLFDIHRMTVQIVTKLLPELLSKEKNLGSESLAMMLHELYATQPSSESPVPVLQDIYDLLHKLHEIAQDYLEPSNDWEFYYQGLWVALIGALRFEELDPKIHQLLLVGAAKAKQFALRIQEAKSKNNYDVFHHVAHEPSPGLPPYKGMTRLDVEDAERFFGRDQLTEKLIEHLKQHQFLAVVGASGSGKSSLVRAGLVARLMNGTANHASSERQWHPVIITPTKDPLQALADGLYEEGIVFGDRSAINDEAKSIESNSDETGSDTASSKAQFAINFVAGLKDSTMTLRQYLHTYSQQNGAATNALPLIVVDQFEELFTHCKDPVLREAFINNLMAAANFNTDEDAESPSLGPSSSPNGNSNARVVCTLRADFYADCLQFFGLRQGLQDYLINVGPMSRSEIADIIKKPASLSHNAWFFERQLVNALLNDMAREDGTLPLLSHALREVWENRRGRTMTLEGYIAAGRIHGSIAKTANGFYEELAEEEQALVRNVFLRLTEIGKEHKDTRRRATLDELISGHDEEQVRLLLNALSDRRLVVLNQDHAEVAHEALIREWDSLQTWLDNNRDELRIRAQIMQAAKEWVDSKRDEGLLFRGARLQQAEQYFRTHPKELTPIALNFMRESLEADERLRLEQERQRQLELDLAEEQARRAKEAQRVAQQQAELARQGSIQAEQEAELAKVQQERAEQEAQIADERATAQAKRARDLRRLAVALGVLLMVPGFLLFRLFVQSQSEWQSLQNFPADTVSSIAVPSATDTQFPICVGTHNIGVACSPTGQEWNIYQLGLPTNNPSRSLSSFWPGKTIGVDTLAFDAKDKNRLFAFLQNQGLYSSSNGGVSWHSTTSSPNCVQIESDLTKTIGFAIAVYGKSIFLVQGFEPERRLYISIDSGCSWKQASPENPDLKKIYDVALNFDVEKEEQLLVGTETGIYATSAVTPDNWTCMLNGIGAVQHILPNPAKPNEYFLATFNDGQGTLYRWNLRQDICGKDQSNLKKLWTDRHRVKAISVDFSRTEEPVLYLLLQDRPPLFSDAKVIKFEVSTMQQESFGRPASLILSNSRVVHVIPKAEEEPTVLLGHSDGLLKHE